MADLASGEAAMRRLALILTLSAIAATPAFAVPQPEAEQAYQRGDYATAFKLWLPLAEQGSPQAQRNIAHMYERGEWVAQDPAMADEWYRRAAQQSAVDAAMPGPVAQQVSPPVQTAYTPLATPPPPPAAATAMSYPAVVPLRPAPIHHHFYHHGHRH